jgi:hypothetical protein
LAHGLGWIVRFEEDFQKRVVADSLRVENDLYRLGMAGFVGADFLIGWVRRGTAGVADRRRPNPGRLPENLASLSRKVLALAVGLVLARAQV